VGLGDTYALMGDEAKARAEYRKAIVVNHDPADRLTYAIQSAMTWVRENKLTAADKAFAAAAEKAHRQNFGLIEAQAYYLMAMYQPEDSAALHRLGQAEAALEHQKNISQSDREEQRARILRWRAVRASQAGNSQLAEESLKQLETMANGSRSTVIPPSYHAAAGALLVAKQKYAEAIPHLQEDSYDPYSLQNLSRAYTETGDTDGSHAVDTKLLAINLPTMEQALVVIPARAKATGK
jgi:tetratricopeptide (TPR) repeat protein